jgi:hypothetical protein
MLNLGVYALWLVVAGGREARGQLQDTTRQGRGWSSELHAAKEGQALLARQLEVKARHS